MSSSDKPYESPKSATSHLPKRKRRYTPPVWIWVVVILCAAIMSFMHVRVAEFDHAVVNIVTMVLSFFALVTLALWFSFFSAYRLTYRFLSVTGAVLALMLLGYLFPFDKFDGVLRPRFKFRWSPKPELLAKPEPAKEGEPPDLATTTPADFPEFLGPGRMAVVGGPPEGLSRDWKANPPKQLWKEPIGAGWSAFSAVNGYAVTLEQRGPEEMVTCYDVRTGDLKWFHAIKARHTNVMGGTGPRSTPTIHAGKVYALGATGVLHCLEGATGKPVWPSKDFRAMAGATAEEDETKVMWGRAGSPLIVDDLVVVPFGGRPEGPHKSLIAFDKNTGEEKWRQGNRNVSYSSPTLAILCGVRQILIVNEDTLSGHDPKTGKELWSHDWPGTSSADANSSQVVPLPPDRVLLSKAYGMGGALVEIKHEGGEWTTEQLWNNKSVLKTKFTNVVVAGLSIFALSDGILECVDLDSGKRQWKSGRYGQGQILGVGEEILVQAESGEVALVAANPERHVELGRFQAIEGVTWNNLCLYGQWLLVRNANEAACYELPVRK